MTPSLLLAPGLLGLAAVCHGIHVHQSGRSTEPLKPFDPAQDSIMVYSRGKTGTTSLQVAAGNMMEPPCKVTGESSHNRAVKCHYHECARSFLKGRPEGSRTWIITSNRNPFSRAPSEMFQGVGVKKIQNTSVDELLSLFHKGEGFGGSSIHGVPQQNLQWFKDSFYDTLGLDFALHPFDFDKKFLRVQHTFDNRLLEIIVLRLEDSDRWKAILKPFFPKIELLGANNTATQKGEVFRTKYAEFLDALHYTDAEIERLSQSDELALFYRPEEKEKFVKQCRDQSARMLGTHDEDWWWDTPADELADELPHC